MKAMFQKEFWQWMLLLQLWAIVVIDRKATIAGFGTFSAIEYIVGGAVALLLMPLIDWMVAYEPPDR